MTAQVADTLVMVRPADFGFNPQTGADNEFQQAPDTGAADIKAAANREFEAMVTRLRDRGIDVLVLEPDPEVGPLPDAIFPNNWFSTTRRGDLLIYPMKTENRRRERRVDALRDLLSDSGYQVTEITRLDESDRTLEGTGALIFDHPRRRIYAALSGRCDPQLLAAFASQHDYEVISFDTRSRSGKPFYHTNVMLSIGEGFTVLCAEAIADPHQRAAVRSALAENHQVIEVSLAQAEENFCANILQVSAGGDPVILLSLSAYEGFTDGQKRLLEVHGELLACPIPTIEKIGGGSARCMVAEIFLPRTA